MPKTTTVEKLILVIEWDPKDIDKEEYNNKEAVLKRVEYLNSFGWADRPKWSCSDAEGNLITESR